MQTLWPRVLQGNHVSSGDMLNLINKHPLHITACNPYDFIFSLTAVNWPRCCRYGIKHQWINQFHFIWFYLRASKYTLRSISFWHSQLVEKSKALYRLGSVIITLSSTVKSFFLRQTVNTFTIMVEWQMIIMRGKRINHPFVIKSIQEDKRKPIPEEKWRILKLVCLAKRNK